MSKFDILRNIRDKIGCSLSEANDFYLRSPEDVDQRLTAQLEAMKKSGSPSYYVSPEQKIRDAINRYYLALDRRQHGGVAQDTAFREIEEVLGMQWNQGEQLKKHEGASDV